jgi:hypothetical protein
MANAREMLVVVESWLGDQDEDLSFGLHNAFDALRLYDYWLSNEAKLSEMADEWSPENRIAALGYDPLDGNSYQATLCGAADAVNAMSSARALLDSVAFIKKENDTRKPIKMIDSVLAG